MPDDDCAAAQSGPEPAFDVWAQTADAPALGAPGRPAAAAIWAEPEPQARDRALQTFRKYLAPGGRLCIITSGPLRRALPEWYGDGDRPAREKPACDPAGLRRTLAWLRRAGFAAEAVYGFHGPLSLAWGAASRLPAALGRTDLADRCVAAVRRDYVVRGWQAHLAPVAVVLAQRLQP